MSRQEFEVMIIHWDFTPGLKRSGGRFAEATSVAVKSYVRALHPIIASKPSAFAISAQLRRRIDSKSTSYRPRKIVISIKCGVDNLLSLEVREASVWGQISTPQAQQTDHRTGL